MYKKIIGIYIWKDFLSFFKLFSFYLGGGSFILIVYKNKSSESVLMYSVKLNKETHPLYFSVFKIS